MCISENSAMMCMGEGKALNKHFFELLEGNESKPVKEERTAGEIICGLGFLQ